MSNSQNPLEIEIRLATCFQAVFPGLDDQAIRAAEHSSIEAWDSVAALSLVDVIEEEFELELDFEEAVQLSSFRAIADYLIATLPSPLSEPLA